MNARIRKLADQCWVENKYGPPWFESDKFTKLIVKEYCAEIEQANPPGGEYATGEFSAGYAAGLKKAIETIQTVTT